MPGWVLIPTVPDWRWLLNREDSPWYPTMRLFRQAADKGSPMAAYNIGMLYFNGHGVKTDRQQARAWFEKSAAAGNEQAIDRLAQIDRECNAGNGSGGQQRAPGAPAGRQPAGKC